MKSLTGLIDELNKYNNIVISEEVHGMLWRDFAEQVIRLIGSRNVAVEWERDCVLIKKREKKII
ncbi:hypothetical protein AM501_19435 [Aneurinibacillus migulanus]|uniref:Uncharacterized protein n=1 Tax=Aneurinibacillus migulanus TaxID=47500 RepID=A0A0D1XQD4_ANEMI|nr:hypothetical protein [Aneurinibacillus migulanus]KIV51906.1 hypothetical protein TS65_25435 [Aneurinibacillus migulanus]KIV54398.1 hypothetical protein TS64_15195 [Aneurinibacillus migulanus]KON98027.1 hypothetical protein AF333_23910 [Aneurinibacillus migulanus]KPD06793.1 hypothetical protein AM501_19435 [Aneurinibacillus migulanus]MCP1354202.1 hypothetical protein [Aneurinibacillus migulanus]